MRLSIRQDSARSRRGVIMVLVALLFPLLAHCTNAAPAAAPLAPAATLPTATAAPILPRKVPATPPLASPTAAQRATFGTLVIAVISVPTPAPSPLQIVSTATAAVAGYPRTIAEAEGEGNAYPRLDPPKDEEITVRAVRLDAPGDSMRQQIRGASPGSFPSAAALPTTGTWLLIASGGLNWGSLILPLPEP